jgi:hypothetical protein
MTSAFSLNALKLQEKLPRGACCIFLSPDPPWGRALFVLNRRKDTR